MKRVFPIQKEYYIFFKKGGLDIYECEFGGGRTSSFNCC